MSEQQYSFTAGKSTSDETFALRILMEKYGVALSSWIWRTYLTGCCERSRVVCKGSVTVVRCAGGVTDGCKVKVGLHQGSAPSPFSFATVMDSLTDRIRQESPPTMMFADDIVICGESREQVEGSLEGSGTKICRSGIHVRG